MAKSDGVFYKRNLAVPFFTQRENTYVWQQKADNANYTGPSRLENWDKLEKVAQLYLEILNYMS